MKELIIENKKTISFNKIKFLQTRITIPFNTVKILLARIQI